MGKIIMYFECQRKKTKNTTIKEQFSITQIDNRKIS